MKRWMLVVLMVGMFWVPAYAQDAGRGGPGDQGGGGGPGGGGPGGPGGGPPPNFNPQEMRQRMMDRLKESMAASDDEWKVLSPKVENVMTLQREARGGGMFGGRPGGGPGGPGGGGPGGGGPGGPGGGGPGGGQGGGPGGPPPDQQQSATAKAQQELRATLDDTSSNAETIAKQLAALRAARAAAKEKLTKAQTELKELLSPRQEAVLVAGGLLE